MVKLKSLTTELKNRFGGRAFEELAANELSCRIESEDVPKLARMLHDDFGARLVLMIAEDLRLENARFDVHYLFSNPKENWLLNAAVELKAENPQIPSLATFYFPASRFERELKDMFGIESKGQPDSRPLVKHAFWQKDFFPLRKDSITPEQFADDGTSFPFKKVGGEGVYEIPVGPVHAGIIEPGHFRFSVLGETVIDMKIRLYFTHKGTEKLFEGRTPDEGTLLAERISGDTTVGHSLAFCQAVEKLSVEKVPERAEYMRVVLLELERLYNHIGDFGAIANDCGFAFANAHCARLRERLLRLNKKLTGNRLLRGSIVPGGVACDFPENLDIDTELETILTDFDEIANICFQNTILMNRLTGAGTLSNETANDHGVLGYVARASGIDCDARRDHPFAAYDKLDFQVVLFDGGDVYARTMVRVKEIEESVRLIKEAIGNMPKGELSQPLGELKAFRPAFSIVEGWRGAIIHWISVDACGRLSRVKVKDPSFNNWTALSFALLDNIVPDFPLCNKSFNQSYSGNDL